jgi:hypothetical protein
MDIVAYHHEFRTALFLSSLTLATFLFTMKTFIIQIIKKEVYDHARHQRMADNFADDKKTSPQYYKGLKSLASLIFWAIVCAVLNASFQCTVGYVDHYAAAIFCILTSVVSWALFAFVLNAVAGNLQYMIDFAEEDVREKRKK